MFESYTVDAKRAVAQARADAVSLGHAEVAPLHLLRALSTLGDPVVDEVLGGRVDAEAGREAARAALPAGSGPKPSYSAPVKLLLVALDGGRGAAADGTVAPAHLLSALLDADDALVAAALRPADPAEPASDALPSRGAAPVPSEPEPEPELESEPEPEPAPVTEPAPASRVEPPPAEREVEPEAVPTPEPLPSRGASATSVEPSAAVAVPAPIGAADDVAPEPEPALEAAEEPAIEPAAAVATAEPIGMDAGLEVARPVPPPRPVETAAARRAAPPAGESLREIGSVLGRAVVLAVGVGGVVYARTARRAKRRADRAGRRPHVVVR